MPSLYDLRAAQDRKVLFKLISQRLVCVRIREEHDSHAGTLTKY